MAVLSNISNVLANPPVNLNIENFSVIWYESFTENVNQILILAIKQIENVNERASPENIAQSQM